jgi:hypothetical protein
MPELNISDTAHLLFLERPAFDSAQRIELDFGSGQNISVVAPLTSYLDLRWSTMLI